MSLPHTEREERADVEREQISGTRRVLIGRIEALHVKARQSIAVRESAEQESAIIRRQPAHAVDEELRVRYAAEIAARAEVECPAADGRDVLLWTHSRREEGQLIAIRSDQHGVAFRLVEEAERT